MKRQLTAQQTLEKRIRDSVEGWVIYLQKQVNDPYSDTLANVALDALKIPFKEIPLRLGDYTESNPTYKILKHRLANNLVTMDVEEFRMSKLSAEITIDGLLEEYQSGDSGDEEYLKREVDVAHNVFKEFAAISKGLVSHKLHATLVIWEKALDKLCGKVFER